MPDPVLLFDASMALLCFCLAHKLMPDIPVTFKKRERAHVAESPHPDCSSLLHWINEEN